MVHAGIKKGKGEGKKEDRSGPGHSVRRVQETSSFTKSSRILPRIKKKLYINIYKLNVYTYTPVIMINYARRVNETRDRRLGMDKEEIRRARLDEGRKALNSYFKESERKRRGNENGKTSAAEVHAFINK